MAICIACTIIIIQILHNNYTEGPQPSKITYKVPKSLRFHDFINCPDNVIYVVLDDMHAHVPHAVYGSSGRLLLVLSKVIVIKL